MIHPPDASRRLLIAGLSGAVLAAGSAAAAFAAKQQPKETKPPPEVVKKIGAVEDLMREHGVLRRVLVVFRPPAGRLRAPAQHDPQPTRPAPPPARQFRQNDLPPVLEPAVTVP